MLFQIYTDNTPLQACDVLIAKEDAVFKIPATELDALCGRPMEMFLVKKSEDLAMKAAVIIGQFLLSDTVAEQIATPCKLICANASIAKAVCSLEYTDRSQKAVTLSVAAQKTAAKPKPPAQKAPAKPMPQNPKSAEEKRPEPGSEKGGDGKKNPAQATGPEKEVPCTDPDTSHAMALLRKQGIGEGQLASCIEAIKEAFDPDITLPTQLQMRLAKNGASQGLSSQELTERLKPVFKEAKELLSKPGAK